MPSVIIVVPPFPNVPQMPGVPQLVRSFSAPASLPPSLGTQAQSSLWAATKASTWGVFDSSGNKVLDPDSVLDFDDRNEWRMSDYTVQANANNTGTGFGTFNKVTLPPENSLRFSKGGSLSDRTDFLNQIEAIAGDTNFYTIITPERSYVNRNITRYEVTRRGASGAYFLCEVDVFFRKIPVAQAVYSSTGANTANAQNAAALPPTNQGNVQATPATPLQEELAFLKLLGS